MKLKSMSILTIATIIIAISSGSYKIHQNMIGRGVDNIQSHYIEDETYLPDNTFSNAKEIRYSGPYLEAKSPDSL